MFREKLPLHQIKCAQGAKEQSSGGSPRGPISSRVFEGRNQMRILLDRTIIARHASVSHTAPAIVIATQSAIRRMRDVVAAAVRSDRPELGKSGLRMQNSVEDDLDFSGPLHRRSISGVGS